MACLSWTKGLGAVVWEREESELNRTAKLAWQIIRYWTKLHRILWYNNSNYWSHSLLALVGKI